MIKLVTDNKLMFIIIHVVIGFFATLPVFPSLFGYIIVAVCVSIVLFSDNRNEEAFIIAAYIVGLEVFLRMIKGAPLFETGKYTTIIVLFLGLINGQTKQKLTLSFPIYLMLLLLGIVFTKVPAGESIRKAIAFNLSGPFMLGVSAIYFYKRTIKISEVYNALFFFLLPVFAMVTFIYFRTPNFSEIVFGGVSLGETSGGFGPNQVATIIGFAAFVIGFFMLTKKTLTGFFLLDAIILMYFTYRGLLTFSRGGILAAGICFVVFALLYIIHKRDYGKIFQYAIVGGVFLAGVWLYTSDVTGGMIDNRYSGRNARGIKKKDVTAGRLELFTSQLSGFTDTPVFGIGVGNGKYKRFAEGDKKGTSHNEVARLIEEHGLIGLFALMMLIFVPLSHFLRLDFFQRSILISFYLFWFFTINHSAMRIAFPGFMYALSLINLRYEEE
ncbi:O-antigen ligase family protein [Pseudotenacibaculum sp. MALMAid0570]|uniref:O-antigen ligase family protein n=1 Tax=Pseudotenacibaculum sp. MALMAid0570 TaxID=3143938 RepID=UPI0032DFE484